MPIRFHFQASTKLNNRRKLKEFMPSLFLRERKELGELDIVFCDNAYLLAINQQYLKHNFYTDIITFDLSTGPKAMIIGELYISVEMVRENAIKYKVKFITELYRVIFHGALHLCGYKDKTKKDISLMRAKEEQYLKMFHGEH